MTTIAFLGLWPDGHADGRARPVGPPATRSVWNRTPERTRPLVAEGARAARDARRGGPRGRDRDHHAPARPAALEAVTAGPDGIAGAISPAACLVEMFTVGPKAALAARDRLPDGTGFVDAPVMGSVGPARSGEAATVLAGWRRSPGGEGARHLRHGRPLRRGRVRRRAQDPPHQRRRWPGSRSPSELLALAGALGVPRDTALDALAAGPLTASVNRIKSTSSDFIITLAAKDLTLATDAADLPQLAAARDWLRTAAAEGAADADAPRRGRCTSAPAATQAAPLPASPGRSRSVAAPACGRCAGRRMRRMPPGMPGPPREPGAAVPAARRPAPGPPRGARRGRVLTRWRWAPPHRRGPGRRPCPAGG